MEGTGGVPHRARFQGPRRRHPERDRATDRSAYLAARLCVFQRVLERHRAFRRDQIARLSVEPKSSARHPRYELDSEATRALRQVRDAVLAGARGTLAEIEIALARIETGEYGYCRSCGADIPLEILEAVPRTTLCRACSPRASVAQR